MKKSTTLIIIILIVVICVGAIILLTGKKECADLDEQECKKADHCLSTLVPVPCENEPCDEVKVEFKECKDKTE